MEKRETGENRPIRYEHTYAQWERVGEKVLLKGSERCLTHLPFFHDE
jgi:hypothetical protein